MALWNVFPHEHLYNLRIRQTWEWEIRKIVELRKKPYILYKFFCCIKKTKITTTYKCTDIHGYA